MKTVVAAPPPPPKQPECFEHPWPPWRTEWVAEGEGWQREVRKKEWRECPECYRYQER